jgi:hypothetical protein
MPEKQIHEEGGRPMIMTGEVRHQRLHEIRV